MKKLLPIILFSMFAVSTYAQGLENVVVEKYYISDANDATANSLGGVLPVFSKIISANYSSVGGKSAQFTIFPNPALNRNVFVSCKKEEFKLLKQIRVYNVYGKLVMSMSVNQKDNLCNGSGFNINLPEEIAGGTLLIVFIGNSVLSSQKLVLY